jgi:uncharacterized protein
MIVEALSKELNLKNWQIEATIYLIDQGNTIPFIANYRKEATGSLDDKTLRNFKERLNYLRDLEDKKKEIMGTIENQGELTDETRVNINEAETLIELEDILRPYIAKKETKALVAKEKGLEPLANIIRFQQTKISIEEIAKDFISEKHGISTVEEAISGAVDIVTEIISDNANFRNLIRKFTFEEGQLVVEAVDKGISSNYERYYEYKEPIIDIANHRVLAINRGKVENILNVSILAPETEIINYLKRHVLIDFSNDYSEEYNELTRSLIEDAILEAYYKNMAPDINTEIWDFLTEKAENQSIEVFSENLEHLLMQGPIRDKIVLGWNSSPYSGCDLAIVDTIGEVLATDIVYLQDLNSVKKSVLEIIDKYNVDVIALGSSSHSEDLEKIVSDIIDGTDVKYAIINQAGASVYSASVLGEIEFPNFSTGQRIAISIARRLQDPLVELVKVDPKSIGVGQYQHDMDQKKLNESLVNVLEKVVNDVGVDLNTAPIPLLVHVSGIDSVVATNIVKYRDDYGAFTSRNELFKVDKLDYEVFKQSSGFLKVYASSNPLDATKIHPESYELAEKFLKKLDFDLKDVGNLSSDSKKLSLIDVNFKDLAKELETGEITLKDIAIQLKNPRFDPRDNMPKTLLRSKALSIDDLKINMTMEGTVRNVVDFGAFVDIGVYHDGLVHISKMQGGFVSHPSDVVSVGDIVKVKIIDLDLDKNRIQLILV